MTAPVLTRRALNRATLARQMLLERADLSPLETVQRLVGLQAQTAQTWYHGLWSRLLDFDPKDLSDLLADRKVVRIALMRSTIHLVTADDCLTLRPLVQPVLERAFNSNFGRNLVEVDRSQLVAAGRRLVEHRPMILSELGRALAERWPDRDPASLAQAIRAFAPLVQVPPRGLWGRSGPAAHTTAEHWLGRPLDRDASLDELVLRYLGAFGPASVQDVQTWCGLTRLGEVVDRLRGQLVTFRDDDGRQLFDLPSAPRPAPDAPAPVRYLYDFDNLLLSHADRSRVVTEEYLSQGFLEAGPMPRIFLADGFTAGTWSVARQRGIAKLRIQPFAALSKRTQADLLEEGEPLLDFAAPGAAHDVELIPPGRWHALRAGAAAET
jgi:Winged helix DNA-binding domain